MRWIFLSLLLMNVAMLAWGLVFREPSKPVMAGKVQPFKYNAVEQLELLEERDYDNPVDDPVDEPSPAFAGQAKADPIIESRLQNDQLESAPSLPMKDGKLICEMVGPFKGVELAGNFVERLAAMGIDSDVKELELPAGVRYQVYLVPEQSQKAALRKLSELQAKKIDSYIIPSGELKNGISLGMYSKEPLAERHVSAMEAIGLAAKMKVIERTYWEIWVMLAPGSGGKMSSFAWARVMEGLNDLQRRQNFCLDVASQDNIH